MRATLSSSMRPVAWHREGRQTRNSGLRRGSASHCSRMGISHVLRLASGRGAVAVALIRNGPETAIRDECPVGLPGRRMAVPPELTSRTLAVLEISSTACQKVLFLMSTENGCFRSVGKSSARTSRLSVWWLNWATIFSSECRPCRLTRDARAERVAAFRSSALRSLRIATRLAGFVMAAGGGSKSRTLGPSAISLRRALSRVARLLFPSSSTSRLTTVASSASSPDRS